NCTENEDDNDSPTFDVNTVGFLAGADYRADARTTLGMTLGADFGDAKIHNGGGKLETADWRLTGFVGKTVADQAFFNAGAQFGTSDIDIKRKSVWGDPKGETTAWNAGVFVEAGVLLPFSKTIAAMPYVGLAYTHTWVEHFREEGAGALWDVDTITADSLRGRIGCGFSWSFDASEMRWRLGLDVAYSHECLGEETDVDAHYIDGKKLPTITAKTLPSDMFSVGPTIDVGISENASIYGGYSFNAGTDSSVNHSANVGFRMRF
ncbi:MAG: autotransporter outer membrane beta-barrel domain-containing protein, partial [Opitutales bacterium]|nr:autotransporter outer membrane beta-barrel domain-containing protein [Opitutales bacterium]